MKARATILLLLLAAALGVLPHAASGQAPPLAGTEAIFPGADRFGPAEGDPPALPAYRGDEQVGWVFRNTDLVDAIGYSGKPIVVDIGIRLDGTLAGAAVVAHSEPILLVGVPEQALTDFVDKYAGTNVLDIDAFGAARMSEIEIISGATVTAIVVDDSIIKAARRFAAARGIGGDGALAAASQAPQRHIDMTLEGTADWPTLVGDGSVRRLQLSVGDVSRAFDEQGLGDATQPESANPDDVFIDLYVALATPPTIGRNLLGDRQYDRLIAEMEPGEQAIIVAGRGLYSFKGSGYVRGGIFDRFQVLQGEVTTRFRDHDHQRIAAMAAAGAPVFDEIGLFRIPPGVGFDPAADWRLELLVNRPTGPIDKVFTAFDLTYLLPAHYLAEPAPQPAATPDTPPPTDDMASDQDQLWQGIWRARAVDIAILALALGFLTIVFFAQDWLVRRPRLLLVVRVGFLIFTVVWIGGWASAQLSVVNILTVFGAFFEGFRWEFFLLEPLIFILWFSLAASLLFWGRGAYCGWLCPFGAAQELINRAAKALKVPQIKVPFWLHQRLWPIKYLIFLGLFAVSLYGLGEAEVLAEVEPFKTAVVLHFDREWYFVAYAIGLLAIGVFIERFFCRYLCPLGAALAIPGRLRMFDWLKRRHQCGTECQICAHECMIQAIHPEGQINPNECLYCLHCQQVYHDDHHCPPLIKRRKRREQRAAAAGPPSLVPHHARRKQAAATPQPS